MPTIAASTITVRVKAIPATITILARIKDVRKASAPLRDKAKVGTVNAALKAKAIINAMIALSGANAENAAKTIAAMIATVIATVTVALVKIVVTVRIVGKEANANAPALMFSAMNPVHLSLIAPLAPSNPQPNARPSRRAVPWLPRLSAKKV